MTVSGSISMTPPKSVPFEVRFTAPGGSVIQKTGTSKEDGFYTLSYAPGEVTNQALWSARTIVPADDMYETALSATRSFTVTKDDTDIYLEVTPNILTVGNSMEVKGRLASANGLSVDHLTVHIIYTDPDGQITTEQVTTQTLAQEVPPEGHFSLPVPKTIDTEGAWTIQAQFAGNAYLKERSSDIVMVTASPVAGYAIIVQGKLLGDSLIPWHNRTANNIYDRFKSLGFSDDDLYYLNFDDTQAHVDEVSSKQAVENAVKVWALNKMNTLPAPLYIACVDHGDVNKFYMGTEYVTGDEMDQWIGSLESNLNQNAADQKIVFVYGACHSGSFIEKLSKKDKNRIVVASADAEEISYPDTPLKGATIADGEFFLNKFFYYASTGKTVKRSFELAANKTQKRYQIPGIANIFGWKHGDSGVQHPVLDDDGDGKGTHYLPTAPPGDGFIAHNLIIGIPPEDPQNVTLTRVSPIVTLEGGTLSEPLWARVSDVSRCETVWIAIKPPDYSFILDSTRTYGEDPGWSAETCNYNAASGRYEYSGLDHFTLDGVYEVFFYAKDQDTGNVSELRKAYLIRSNENNNAPASFHLLSPANNAQGTSSLNLTWETAADPDGDNVSYIAQISEDDTFDTPVFQSLEESPFLIVDKFSELQNLGAYYWRVIAVDEKGGRTECADGFFRFTTFDGNGIPGLLIGYVYDAATNQEIGGATIEIENTHLKTKALDNGWFVISVPSGNYQVKIHAEGFDKAVYQQVNIQSENRKTMSVSLSKTGDQTNPVVTLDHPAADQTVGSPAFTLSGSATDEGGSGLARVEVSIDDGGQWNPVTGLNPWTYAATLSIGPNVIRVRALDNAANQAEAGPLTLTFDETSRPEISQVLLTPASPVGAGSVTFTITFDEAMDPLTLPEVSYGYTPVLVAGQFADSTTWQGTRTVTSGEDGAYTLTVTGAGDIYGNIMDPDASCQFTVDTTEPTAPTIQTSPQSIKSNAMLITLSEQAQDVNFSHYQLKGGRKYPDWTDTTLTNGFIFELLPGTVNTLMVRGMDAAGNPSQASSVDITSEYIYEPGDINGDRAIALDDAILSLKVINRVDTQGAVAPDYVYSGAEVNGDGKVGLAEVIYIMKRLVE